MSDDCVEEVLEKEMDKTSTCPCCLHTFPFFRVLFELFPREKVDNNVSLFFEMSPAWVQQKTNEMGTIVGITAAK